MFVMVFRKPMKSLLSNQSLGIGCLLHRLSFPLHLNHYFLPLAPLVNNGDLVEVFTSDVENEYKERTRPYINL